MVVGRVSDPAHSTKDSWPGRKPLKSQFRTLPITSSLQTLTTQIVPVSDLHINLQYGFSTGALLVKWIHKHTTILRKLFIGTRPLLISIS